MCAAVRLADKLSDPIRQLWFQVRNLPNRKKRMTTDEAGQWKLRSPFRSLWGSNRLRNGVIIIRNNFTGANITVLNSRRLFQRRKERLIVRQPFSHLGTHRLWSGFAEGGISQTSLYLCFKFYVQKHPPGLFSWKALPKYKDYIQML